MCGLKEHLDLDSSFSQTHKIDNNGNIGIKGFTTWKQKKIQQQNVTQVSIEPGT